MGQCAPWHMLSLIDSLQMGRNDYMSFLKVYNCPKFYMVLSHSRTWSTERPIGVRPCPDLDTRRLSWDGGLERELPSFLLHPWLWEFIYASTEEVNLTKRVGGL